jgi:hypothetical protein
MSRFLKVFGVAAMSSVYLMQAPCTTTGGSGVSLIPNVPNLFNNLFGGLI